MSENTNESQTAGNQAANAAAAVMNETRLGFLVMLLECAAVIAAAVYLKAAKKFLEKSVTLIKEVKGFGVESALCAATLVQETWPLIAYRLRQLGWLTIAGIFGSLIALIWFDEPVGAAWVMLALGAIWYLMSLVIYEALAPLEVRESGKKWRLALSRPFAVVALLVIAIGVLVLALPGPFRNVSVVTLVAGIALLLLSRSVLIGEKNSNAFSHAVIGAVILAVYALFMAAFPALDNWVEAKAEQAARSLEIDSVRTLDQYQSFMVTTGGYLLDENGKPQAGVPLKAGDIVKVDVSREPGKDGNKTKSFPGLGVCRTTYRCEGTTVVSGRYPLQYMKQCAIPTSANQVMAAAPDAPAALSSPPLKSSALRASLSGFPAELIAATKPDLSQNDWRGLVGDEWVNTGLVVYPQDGVIWGPFNDDEAALVISENGEFLLQFCLGIKIPANGGGFEYLPAETVTTPEIFGGAGAYFGLTSVWGNVGNAPMLIRYVGGSEPVKIKLVLERNRFNAPERRQS